MECLQEIVSEYVHEMIRVFIRGQVNDILQQLETKCLMLNHALVDNIKKLQKYLNLYAAKNCSPSSQKASDA